MSHTLNIHLGLNTENNRIAPKALVFAKYRLKFCTKHIVASPVIEVTKCFHQSAVVKLGWTNSLQYFFNSKGRAIWCSMVRYGTVWSCVFWYSMVWYVLFKGVLYGRAVFV